MSGFRQRTRAGMRGRPALCINHRDLANLTEFIGGQQTRERLRRGMARTHQVEAERPIAAIDEGLGRDRANLGLGMDDHRADREPMRLDRGSQFAGIGVARDNRVGMGELKLSS